MRSGFAQITYQELKHDHRALAVLALRDIRPWAPLTEV